MTMRTDEARLHRGARVAAFLCIWTFGSLAISGSLGCKSKGAGGANASASGDASDLATPDLVLKDDTRGFLLTWVDDKGDFHVAETVADVPMTGRDAVRVVDPSREASEDFVVADLRSARLDGTYPLRMMHRVDFEQLAVARRQQNGPTLVSNGQPDGGVAMGAGEGAADHPNDPAPGRPTVIVYGASWCSACHQAAAYLKSKHVNYVEKDIEADSSAAQEMNGKLQRFGLHGGSIPVLDVRGRVMVGFNPHEVDDALGAKI
jgi:glutaredoxin